MEFNEILTAMENSDQFDLTFDMQHRLVARTKEPVEYPIKSLFNTLPFQHTSFITIEKPDVDNIIDMLNESIDLRKSGTREDEDVEVFGDRAIGYERLFDMMGYVDYTPPLIAGQKAPTIITADVSEIDENVIDDENDDDEDDDSTVYVAV